MASVKKILDDIAQLDPTEQKVLIEKWWPWFLRYPPPWFGSAPSNTGIEATPGICGGEPRIVRTRIPVWVLERLRQLGVSEAEILRSYPTLRAEDLVHAWAYVDLHRDEINEQIRANEEA